MFKPTSSLSNLIGKVFASSSLLFFMHRLNDWEHRTVTHPVRHIPILNYLVSAISLLYFATIILGGMFILAGLYLIAIHLIIIRSAVSHKKHFHCTSLINFVLSEQVLGDLQEEREEIIQTSGLQVADRWYKRQVLASLWPQLRRAVRLIIIKIAP